MNKRIKIILASIVALTIVIETSLLIYGVNEMRIKNIEHKSEVKLFESKIEKLNSEISNYKMIANDYESMNRELNWALDQWNGWSSRNQETIDMIEEFWRSCMARGGC